MANKKAVLTKPTPDATIARNAFDRESMRCYHYALGQLVAPWWEVLTAGSHCKLNRKIFQRTCDLNTAAFPIMDTHIQYYFVPFRQMWSLWDDFKLGIRDVHSTSLVNPLDTSSGSQYYNLPSRAPYTTLTDIYATLAIMSQNGLIDIFGNELEPQAEKLLNMLGYGLPSPMASYVADVNLWPLLAYHKIYYDHFRNTQYEPQKPALFNMDYLWSQNRSMLLPSSELYGQDGLLAPHYVNYRNDYFTNIYPSLNYLGTTSLYNSNRNSIGVPSSVQNTINGLSNTYGNFGVFSNNNGVLVGNQTSGQTNKLLTLQTLRSAFALDKLQRSSAYAGQHAKEQYEARFGIKFKDSPNHSIFIGAFKNDIQIGEVTSTADTGSSGLPLGAIGGKGVGFDDWGKTLEFTAEEDGIVMAIQYTTIRSCYRSAGIDSYLIKHLPEDYFQPEFQNLGLEPVYGLELNQSLGTSTLLGFRPRNQRYKLGVDKSYGLFADIGSDLSMFINHTDVARIPTVGQQGVSYSWFKVAPNDLDQVARVAFDGTMQTDHFFGQTIFGCTVNQNMTVHGQPSL